ncbi:hemerythrin domain-containing protein [Candidatus Pacearchaeota archaeon]|nr:hemerythrin domain-containing protein [Candidatus Pacearchaeota archaeon]
MNNKIINIMNKEHKMIRNIFNAFENNLRFDFQSSKEIFRVFVWNLEKHIFIEEKIIYSVYSVWNNSEEILGLLGDHKDILYLIKKIENTLSKNKIPNVSDLKIILNEHFILEEEILFPLFDDVLKGNLRELFLDRTNEVIIG